MNQGFIRSKSSGELEKQVSKEFFSSALDNVDSIFDPGAWVFNNLHQDLYDNQIEIVENIVNLSISNLVILGARSSGKSWSVATGLAQLCIIHPRIRILVFAPKAEQANRLTEYIHVNVITKDGPNSKYIDWLKTTKTRIYFKNGSIISAHSGAMTAKVESAHGDVLVIDEAQHLADQKFSQALTPMLAASKIGKIIKLGVPLFKGHFWKSYNNPAYTKLVYDWLHAPILRNRGVLVYEGVEYPQYAVDLMPYSLKKEMFPNQPELWTEGEMSEIDFRTQFMMEWVSDINLAFPEKDQLRLIDSQHLPLEQESPGELYYFGLDFAGGEQISEGPQHDYTALTVWRKTFQNKKELVFAKRWQGNSVEQLEDIMLLINPITGVFKCKFGLADYGNMGIAYVDMMKTKYRIPIEGILFGAKDPGTGKRFKESMYNHFVFELQADRAKFPDIKLSEVEALKASDNIKTIAEAIHEIGIFERRKGVGSNIKLTAPYNAHDDLVCSALLGVFAADQQANESQSAYKLPKMVIGPSILSRPGYRGIRR